jgi:hypothetical protein
MLLFLYMWEMVAKVVVNPDTRWDSLEEILLLEI